MTDDLIPDETTDETATEPAEQPVSNFLDDLAKYIEDGGYTSVFTDFKPAAPDNVICVFVYHSMPGVDGGITRRVQVQVRHTTDAYRIAHELAALLDSGYDEELILMNNKRWTVLRPTAGPRLMEHDAKGRATYYFEFAASGDASP